MCMRTVYSVTPYEKHNDLSIFIAFHFISTFIAYDGNLFGFVSLTWKISLECATVAAVAAATTTAEAACLSDCIMWVLRLLFQFIYLFCFYNFSRPPVFRSYPHFKRFILSSRTNGNFIRRWQAPCQQSNEITCTEIAPINGAKHWNGM